MNTYGVKFCVVVQEILNFFASFGNHENRAGVTLKILSTTIWSVHYEAVTQCIV